MLPNFLGIGAQKAGSTWLYYNLSKHPQIWLPPIKENYYFSEKECHLSRNLIQRFFDDSSWYNKRWRSDFQGFFNRYFKQNKFKTTLKNLGKDRYFNWYLKFLFERRNDEWYRSLFDIAEPQKIRGDINPGYSILNAESVAHIHRLMPDTKVILLLRNPISRAWSHACMKAYTTGKNINDFTEEELKALFNQRGFVELGNYPKMLEVWQSYYPHPEQLFIGFFEDIRRNPDGLLTEICNFIGVEASSEYLNSVKKQQVNSARQKKEIPPSINAYLAQMYYDDIKYLNKRFGNKTNSWLDSAEKLIVRS